MKLNFILVLVCLCFIPSFGQWTPIDSRSAQLDNPSLQDGKYRLYHLDRDQLISKLDSRSAKNTIAIPTANGDLVEYAVQSADIFHPNMVAKYPFLKSYKGKALDNSAHSIRIAMTRNEVYVMGMDESGPSLFINYVPNSDQQYVVFNKEDYTLRSDHDFQCMVEGHVRNEMSGVRFGDCMLRRYRLALACTAEYAQFHGGTVESVLEAYNVAMARVNGIYERDAAITMQIIDGTDQLIFFDAATDPYTNNDGGTMLGQNQTTIDNIIGSDNYDIGHVFSTGGGGIASLQSPCSSRKAQGVTGQSQPIGDPFTVDYVAHEMGHQYGANHTQNNGCNRVQATAMEPGSASTIMGYAGICAPNVQSNSDAYFHAISLQEMASFVTGSGNLCATIVPTTNTAPTVTVAQESYTIPASTSFLLEAMGSDADGDNLTYCWEQMDNEIATMPPLPTNTGGPAFRSLDPTTNPIRYCPSITNPNPTWEVLPSVSRQMNFNCTVRDNNQQAGCTAEIDVNIVVDGNSGPLVVNYPNGGEQWKASEMQTITWDVANTDQAPVSASMVDIYLSTDGGASFEILIAENVPNNGSYEISVPSQKTDQARIMVRGSGNIFYDVSNANFSITAQFAVAFDPGLLDICGDTEAQAEMTVNAFDGFSEAVQLSVGEVPAGLTATLSSTEITPPATVTLNMSTLDMVTPGNYFVEVIGMSATEEVREFLPVNIQNANVPAVALNTPFDETKDLPIETTLQWDALPGVTNYDIEVSVNSNFEPSQTYQSSNTSIVISELLKKQVYYWRVKANSSCSNGEFGEVRAFRTLDDGCSRLESTDVPKAIPEESNVEINSTLEITSPINFMTAKVAVRINHSWAGDLAAQIIAPDGTVFNLFDRPGEPNSQFGCNNPNINVTLYNSAEGTAAQLDNSCESGGVAVEGDYMPIDAFTDISGEASVGTWTLRVTDGFQQDGGSLVSWSIEDCQPVEIPEIDLTGTRVINVSKGESTVFDHNIVSVNSDEVYQISLVKTPQSGLINRSGTATSEGSVLVNGDFVAGNYVYQHNDNDETSDEFLVDIFVPSTGQWWRNGAIQVNIVDAGFQAFANVVDPISCNGSADGAISASGVGGDEPYEYSLDNMNFQSENTFTGLAAGTYTIYVRDADGTLEQAADITLSEPDAISLELVVQGYNINAIASGGNGSYTYSVEGIGNNVSGVFENVANAAYTVIATDSKGCTGSAVIEVNIPELTSSITVANLSCANVNDGSISIAIDGGVAPYEFSLDGDDYTSDNTFGGLPMGDYTVYVRDAGEKVISSMHTITSPDAITYEYSAEGNMISINSTGGTGAHTYTLGATTVSNPFEITDFSNTYDLFIQDENDCQFAFELTFNTIQGLNVNYDETICTGETGSISIVSVQGGDAPYQFSLNGGAYQSSNNFSDLPAGDYVISVRTKTGLIYTHESITIAENPMMSIATTSSSDTLYVQVAGGTPGYEYSTNGQIFVENPFFVGLEDGTYTIYVRDAAGCVSSIEVMYTDVADLLPTGSISISPNPASSQLVIAIPALDNTIQKIEVRSMDGRVVDHIEIDAKQSLQYSTSKLSAGLYFFRVSTAEGLAIEKVAIVR